MIIASLMSAAIALQNLQVNQTLDTSDSMEVIYTIPEGQGLDAPLSMALDDASFRMRGGLARMSFRLPDALTGGVSEEFRLQGAIEGDSIEMKGPSSKAQCKILLRTTDCTVSFEKLPGFTLPGVERAPISQTGPLAGEELGHQPIGVISFPHTPDVEQSLDY